MTGRAANTKAPVLEIRSEGAGYIAQRFCGCIRFAQRMDTTALSPTSHSGAKAVRWAVGFRARRSH
ncbi:MAG: hypothetical protein ACOCTM_02870 [Bacteroidota bacterium]